MSHPVNSEKGTGRNRLATIMIKHAPKMPSQNCPFFALSATCVTHRRKRQRNCRNLWHGKRFLTPMRYERGNPSSALLMNTVCSNRVACRTVGAFSGLALGNCFGTSDTYSCPPSCQRRQNDDKNKIIERSSQRGGRQGVRKEGQKVGRGERDRGEGKGTT